MRLFYFVQILSSADMVSKSDIEAKLDIHQSTFYKYLSETRDIFKVTYQGSMGGNAYYSIDKAQIKNFFKL